MSLHRDVRVFVAGRAVDAQPNPSPSADQVLHPAHPRTQPHVARGTVGDAGLDLSDPLDLRVVQVDAVGVPHVVARPVEILHQLSRPAAELLDAEALFVQRLSQVRMQANAVPSRQGCGIAHELGGDRERRARRHHDPSHRPGLRVVVAIDHRFGVDEDGFLLLDHGVRRQAALRLSKRHRPAARMEAKAKLLRHLDERLEDSGPVVWKDVVMVGRERAAAQQQARHRSAGRNPHRFGVDARPDRIEGAEPLE